METQEALRELFALKTTSELGELLNSVDRGKKARAAFIQGKLSHNTAMELLEAAGYKIKTSLTWKRPK